MTSRLSQSFYGNKKMTQQIYNKLRELNKLSQKQVLQIFKPYTIKLSVIVNTIQSSVTLLQIFTQFMNCICYSFLNRFQFLKFSTLIQLSAHVFEYSFQNWLSSSQSFKYFSEVLIRHSLFRPPHSVCVFNENQMKLINQWWVDNFYRYYQEYEQGFKSILYETININLLPNNNSHISSLKQAKVVEKSTIDQFIKFNINQQQ